MPFTLKDTNTIPGLAKLLEASEGPGTSVAEFGCAVVFCGLRAVGSGLNFGVRRAEPLEGLWTADIDPAPALVNLVDVLAWTISV